MRSYNEQIHMVFDSLIKQQTHAFEEAPSKHLFISILYGNFQEIS